MQVTCQLETGELWERFFQLGTEMIITKSGRSALINHKIHTYVEYRTVSGVFQNIDPHPLSTLRVCPPPPRTKGGGYKLAGR
jgi:hypothetical protein